MQRLSQATRLWLLKRVNKHKSSQAKNGWLRCSAEEASHLSNTILSLSFCVSLCMWLNTTIYLLQNSMLGNHLISIASFDSNDFIKPLILARSPWLRHCWMPPTLECSGNLFPPWCSSSWCNSHSDKNPSLWYLATKWEEGWKEGDQIFCDHNQKRKDGY